MKKKIDVCLTRELLHLYDLTTKVVVIVDIFRATSCIVTGLANQVERIIPVATPKECKELQKQGFVAAGEQLGLKVEGFDVGNSPLSYLDSVMKGRSVALTTTNGVKALKQAESAYQIVIGAFLNLSAVTDYIKSQEKDVLVVAAGWRGHFNLEDSLFAGALVEKAIENEDFETETDSAWAALNLYQNVKDNLDKALKSANHYQRLLKFDCQKDIDFCLTIDTYKCLPILKNGELILNEQSPVNHY
jgi:2-phosphosulfolactate phosphatase